MKSIKNSYFRKTFLSFALTTVLLFLCFTVLISVMIVKNYHNTVIKSGLSNLEHSSGVSENAVGSIYNYTYLLFKNDTALNNLLYAQNYSQQCSLDFHSFKDSLLYYGLIDSFYIINFPADMAFSSKHAYTTLDQFEDPDILTFLKSEATPVSILLYEPRTLESTDTDRQDPDGRKNLLSMIFRKTADNAFVVNLDQEAYLNLAQNENSFLPELIICNNRGNVIVESSYLTYGQTVSDYEWYQTIAGSPKKSGYFETSLNGRPVTLLYQKDTLPGFTYISTVGLSVFSADNRMFTRTILYFIVFVFLGLILAIGISWLIYIPILRLKTVVRQFDKGSADAVTKSGHADARDDLGYITDVMTELIEDYHSSKKTKKQYLISEKNRFLQNMLQYEGFAATVTQEQFERFELDFDGSEYLVILFYIDDTGSMAAKDYKEYLLYYNAMINIADELTAVYPSAEHVRMENGFLAYLLTLTDYDEAKLTSVIKELQNHMYDYFKITVSAGVGTPAEDGASLHRSFTEAEQSLRWRFIYGKGSLIVYSGISEADDSSAAASLSRSVTAAVTGCQTEALQNALSGYFEQLRPLGPNKAIIQILSLNLALQKTEASLSLTPLDFFSSHRNFYEDYTLDEIHRIFRERCLADIEMALEIKKNHSVKPQLIEQVVSYVNDHLCDSGMTVESLACMTGISTNYLRAIFKENMGISLSNYIAEQKIAYACRLLRETSCPIQKICDMLDFSTKNYFYTYFKKHVGMTPSQYRERERS